MNILAWILLGLIAGSIANMVDPHPSEGGFLGSIVLGVLGALAGGFLANLLFGLDVTGFNFTSLAVSTLGALLLLFLGRAIRRT